MRAAHRPHVDLSATARTFQTAATAIGGLYLATHSVTITAIGTSGVTAITAWLTWLTTTMPQADQESGAGARGPNPHQICR